MARLIDGDTLITWIKGSQQMTSKMKSIICYIKTMPTIDAVSVVHGEWIDRSEDGRILHPWWESYECNQCGRYGSKAWNFCPNCGCRMKGADDEVLQKL